MKRTLLLILSLASLPACEAFFPSEAPHGLWVGQTAVVLEPEESFTFTASFQEHGGGATRPSAPIEPAVDARWWSDDPDIVSVRSDRRGTVEALAPGTTTVWVEMGARRDSATVTVLAGDEAPTHRWKDVSTWQRGTCALDEAGHAYCWGDDFWGGWGTGGERRQWTNAYRPLRVSSQLSFEEIGKGLGFACARTGAGEVWCWGYHLGAILGHGRTGVHYETAPVRVRFPGRAVSLAVGGMHACLLDDAGQAHCWGTNLSGELGIGGDATSSRERGGRTVPVAFDGTFEEIYAEAFMSCGLTPAGDLYCWGRTYGGSATMGEMNPLPSRITSPVRPHRVQPGDGASYILSTDGRLHVWGHSLLAPVGFNQTPTPADTERRFSEISLACGLGTDAEAWCWGTTAFHRFDPAEASEPCPSPASTLQCSFSPVRVPGGHQFRTLSVGLAACGVSIDGRLYCWGDNGHGQLGHGRPGIEGTHVPQRVLDPL